MAKRVDLVAKPITDKNGKETTVHVRNESKVSTKKMSPSLVMPPSAVEKAPVEAEVEEVAIAPVPKLAFRPNREWGLTHLNARNFRIARAINVLDPEVQKGVVRTLADDGDAPRKDYTAAIGISLTKWNDLAEVKNNKSVEVPESLHEIGPKRHKALTELADNEEACWAIANEVNRVKAEDDPDVEAEDVKLTVELIRDSTSNRETAMQARTYAIRSRRQDLLFEIQALTQEAETLEKPLRDLATQYTDGKYTYDLGGDDGEALIDFTPRKNFNEDLARADLAPSELKKIEVKRYDFGLLKNVVGEERYERYRVQGKTAMTIR